MVHLGTKMEHFMNEDRSGKLELPRNTIATISITSNASHLPELQKKNQGLIFRPNAKEVVS